MPLGMAKSFFLSSLKNRCEHASRAVMRLVGVYSSMRLIRSIASSGVVAGKTLVHGCGLIWGNLISFACGFIERICSLVGVPITLIISTN